MKILAVYVGSNADSRRNLEHGLKHGVWGFKDSVKPEDFETLAEGDLILLGSGFSGGSPRVSSEEWKKHELATIHFATITGKSFTSAQPEWPDENQLAESDRYRHRIRFDPVSVKTLNRVSLSDHSQLSEELAEQFRKSGAANGRGYVLEGLHFTHLSGVQGTQTILQQHFEAILSRYVEARTTQPFSTENPVCGHFVSLRSALVQNPIVRQRSQLNVKWSAGQGNWARVPWLVLMDRRETPTTQRGVYCVYLFRQDMSGVYLTFNQGVTEVFNELGRQRGEAELRNRAHDIRETIPWIAEKGFSLADDIDLKADPGLGADYETSTIAHKFYATGAIPDDATLIADLEAVLRAYDHYLEHKNSELALGHPFDEIFSSFDEARWAFDLLRFALVELGVDPAQAKDDRRISLTLSKRSGEGIRLRLNFGNWAILTFRNQASGSERLEYICREDLLPASAPAVRDSHRFAEEFDGRRFVLASCEVGPMRRPDSDERKAFAASLPMVAQRFKDWESSPYRGSHQAKALEMVFDASVRDERLQSGLESPPEKSLSEILRRYHEEQIVFVSSSENQRYAIASVDETGVSIDRLDANAPERLTFTQADKLIEGVRAAGAVDFTSWNHTAAIRNAVLQAEPLALSADRKSVEFLSDSAARLRNFQQVLAGMNRSNPFYKPAILLCVLDGIDSGELEANRITFDWIAPRFIAKMKALGRSVTDREAAQPFYHLANDLFWLHAVPNRKDLMQSGGDGPAAARSKINYALLKDTYWNLLQDPDCREKIREQLESLMMPVTSSTELLSLAETAIRETGFQQPTGLVGRLLTALVTKPFVILTGNSGTGKTKLAQLLTHWLVGDATTAESRYAIVPVGADWTDNRNVVGFVNHLRKDADGRPIYQSTAVLDLLLRAGNDSMRPYFLILDEMNLSHVERYFSDFLSAMESGKPIPLHSETSSLRTPAGQSVDRAIAYPENLFIIGTVNVDETTYMFSPKVLDRANVLEFRVAPEQAKSFLANPHPHLGKTTPNRAASIAFLSLSRRARGLAEPTLASLEGTILTQTQEALSHFFTLLHGVRLEFAFRTLAEIQRYLQVNFEMSSKDPKWDWKSCLDAQVLQKILPKLHGSRRRLEPILVALARYCEDQNLKAAEAAIQRDAELNSYPGTKAPAAIAFPLSHGKLIEMLETVRRDQFVSFIQ